MAPVKDDDKRILVNPRMKKVYKSKTGAEYTDNPWDDIDELFTDAAEEAMKEMVEHKEAAMGKIYEHMGLAGTLKPESRYDNHYIVFDAESNGLLYDVTQCHCIVFYSSLDGEMYAYWDDPYITVSGIGRSGDCATGIKAMVGFIRKGHVVVGHNITGYDFHMFKKMSLVTPMDQKYFSVFNPRVHIEDTYVNCCLLNPEQPPGLEYWGKKLGIFKPHIEDWSVCTEDTIKRCIEDVKINKALYEKQMLRLRKYDKWQEAQELEKRVNWIHSEQVMHGIRIDILKAQAQLKHLDYRLEELKEIIHPKLPPTVIKGDTYVKPFLKSGGVQKYIRDYFSSHGVLPFSNVTDPVGGKTTLIDPRRAVRIGGQFSKVSFEDVNLNSHPRVKEILLGLGWVPTEYNYKKDKKGAFQRDERGQLIETSPKLTEDSYASLPKGLGSEIAEFLMLSHRRRFILNETDPSKGLLSFVRPETGYAPAEAFTCGTNTGRYRHKGALVNLPRPKTTFGKELRSLFTVPFGKLMVGIDLSGIEARVMAHYAYFYDKGKYLKVVLDTVTGEEKDIHAENARILGVTRDTAKSFLYAISYGAGAKKLASVLGTTIPKAKVLIKKYWDTHSGLRDLVTALESEHTKSGSSIVGIDGRKLYIRSSHKLLNTLVQAAAAVIFKKWMVLCYMKNIEDYGESRQILAYHDELGWEIPDDSGRTSFAVTMVKLIQKTGREMKLNVPLNGDYKIGTSYDQVH